MRQTSLSDLLSEPNSFMQQYTQKFSIFMPAVKSITFLVVLHVLLVVFLAVRLCVLGHAEFVLGDDALFATALLVGPCEFLGHARSDVLHLDILVLLLFFFKLAHNSDFVALFASLSQNHALD